MSDITNEKLLKYMDVFREIKELNPCTGNAIRIFTDDIYIDTYIGHWFTEEKFLTLMGIIKKHKLEWRFSNTQHNGLEITIKDPKELRKCTGCNKIIEQGTMMHDGLCKGCYIEHCKTVYSKEILESEIFQEHLSNRFW